jgi:cation transport ATPase
MSDDIDRRFEPQPLARWFYAGAGASFLFMALGCIAYVMHVSADPATLPPDQRFALAAEPAWVTGAYAVTVWAGLFGAVLLLLRRKAAEMALLVSLLALVAWVAGMALIGPLRDSLSTNDWAVTIVILAVTWTIYWFARHSRQRGWLR